MSLRKKSPSPIPENQIEHELDEFTPLLRKDSQSTEGLYGIHRIAPAVLFYALGYGIYVPSYFELMRYKVRILLFIGHLQNT